MSVLHRLIVLLIAAFILAPIVVVVAASLSDSAMPEFPPRAISLRWYAHALNEPVFTQAALNSLWLASISTVVAAPLALAAAYAVLRGDWRGRDALQTVLLAPLVVPALVIGLAILLAFSGLGIRDVGLRLVGAHVLVTFPYMVRTILASLARLDPVLEEAARTLGAHPLRGFLHVTLPLVRPGLIAGMLFAFIVSFDNVSVSLFLTSTRTNTLPLAILNYVEYNFDPSVAAISTMLIAFSLGAAVLMERLVGLRRVLGGLMATVELRALRKTYGTAVAVDDVSLAVPSGSFVTLLGPSGCGKTTTLRAIAGLVQPDSGEILLGGEDVTRIPTHRRDLGMVFQSHALFPHMTVAENVGFGLRMRGVARADRAPRVAEALALVRLEQFGARYPAQLSGGQQQRVALARALVIQPRVLLLDEPFGALDRKLRETMQAELRELTRRLGITAIFVTHDQEEALILSDRIAVMHAGRIEQMGAPFAVFEQPSTRFVADFMGMGNILAVHRAAPWGAAPVLDAGGLLLQPDLAPPPGMRHVAIRAERIAIVPPDEEAIGPNGCDGVVIDAVYHGSLSTYRVRPDVASGLTLLVREASRAETMEGPRIGPGSRVRLVWAPGAVRMLTD